MTSISSGILGLTIHWSVFLVLAVLDGAHHLTHSCLKLLVMIVCSFSQVIPTPSTSINNEHLCAGPLLGSASAHTEIESYDVSLKGVAKLELRVRMVLDEWDCHGLWIAPTVIQ